MNTTTASRKPVPKSAKPFTIVVGLGFNDSDGPAFDESVQLALKTPKSELHLIHVFDAGPSPARAKQLIEHIRLYVNEKAAQANGLKGISVGIHLRSGTVVHQLAQFATDVHADLLVLGSQRGPNLTSWLIGSTAGDLISAGPCPVLVATPRSKESSKYKLSMELPCEDCVRARSASAGAQWWCDRHAEHMAKAHTYSYQRDISFATHDSEVIPTGIDFGKS